MAVLIAVNESILSCEVPSSGKAKEIVKQVIAKYKEMSVDFDAEAGMGVDPNVEDFMLNYLAVVLCVISCICLLLILNSKQST